MRKANAALELHLASLSRQLVALRAAKMQPTTAARPGLRADLRSAETCADVDAATRGVRCASLSAADARCIRALREQIRDLDCLGGTVSGCSGGGGGDGGGDGRDVLPRGALLPASDVGGGASELSIAASGLVAALAEAARRHAMDVSAIGVAHQARVAEVVQRSRGARIADREAAAAAAELHAEELRRIESDGAQRAAELERQRGVASAREAECKRRIAAARARVAPLLAIVDQRNDAIELVVANEREEAAAHLHALAASAKRVHHARAGKRLHAARSRAGNVRRVLSAPLDSKADLKDSLQLLRSLRS